jgi:predicted DCC family thiol-disulfide oxidoreductase YuxK
MCVTAKSGLERLTPEGNGARMIPYQSEEAKRLLGARYHDGRPDAAFLVAPDGRISSGLDAFLPLLPGLAGGRLLAWLFRIPFMKPVAYLIYWIVAKYRYQAFGEVPLDR